MTNIVLGIRRFSADYCYGFAEDFLKVLEQDCEHSLTYAINSEYNGSANLYLSDLDIVIRIVDCNDDSKYRGLRPDMVWSANFDCERYFINIIGCKICADMFDIIRYIVEKDKETNKNMIKKDDITLEIKINNPNFEEEPEVVDAGRGLFKRNNVPILPECSVRNIIKDSKKIEDDGVNKCLNELVSYLCRFGIHKMVYDITEAEKSLMPAREMTMQELEDALGYKIKIVKEKKNGK